MVILAENLETPFMIIWLLSFPFQGYVWGRLWRAGGCKIHRLYLEKQLFLFRMWQEPLLQDYDHSLRVVHCARVGLRICHAHISPCVVLDTMLERFLHHDGMCPEVLRNLPELLHNTMLWSIWISLQQNKDSKIITTWCWNYNLFEIV
jgi:hypothetical protein